jgi:hypothetical protein
LGELQGDKNSLPPEVNIWDYIKGTSKNNEYLPGIFII